jgi:2-hydroxy-3-oxopropionate reductase
LLEEINFLHENWVYRHWPDGFSNGQNLLDKSLDLNVFSRTIEKAKPLEKFGAKISNSLSEAVKDVDIVITMLTDDDAVEKVLSDQDFQENLKKESTVVDMSSIKPKIAIKYGKLLKDKSINFLDAPCFRRHHWC